MKKLVISALLLVAAISASAAEKYAVLITGDHAAKGIPLEKQWNEGRDNGVNTALWNDTYLMWEQLRKKGYKDENIFVLFADGIDYTEVNPLIDSRYNPLFCDSVELQQRTISDYPATINNVKNVFNILKTKTTTNDFLFVWTFDHGDLDLATNHSAIWLLDENLQNNVNMWDTTFARLVNQVPVNKKVVWMHRYNAQIVTDC